MYSSPEMANVWQQGQATRAAFLGPATAHMLDLADLRPGGRVLDVATGSGELLPLIIERIGASGSAAAIDNSPAMISRVTAAIQQAGLTNIEIHLMNAEQIDLPPESFDRVVCRLGLHLFANLPAAMAGIRRVLVSGGRFSGLIWSTLERNPVHHHPLAVACRAAGVEIPVPGQPDRWALAKPGALAAAFNQAGFRHVQVDAVPLRWRFATTAEAVDSVRSFPLLQLVLGMLDEARREAVWEEIANTYRQFEAPSGWEAPGEFLIAAGTK